MAWSDEAEQGLPPQRHREPAALRREILDELTDHLALAAERESESGAEDDQQIRTRVLKKFGNPAAIARSLWWDAMKETLMKDWIQISINGVICIAVVGFMALFYRQMQTTNTALINALNDRPSAADELYPSVEFILHRGSIDGPLAEGIQLDLRGKAFSEDSSDISDVSDIQGRAKFGPIRAGRYSVSFKDKKTGLTRQDLITLYVNDGTKTVHVAVPPAIQIPLNLTAPSALHISDTDIRLLMSMRSQWSYDGDNWNGEKRNFIVTPDGTYSSRSYSGNDSITQPEERITQTYGNRVMFIGMGIAQSRYPQEGGDEWFGKVRSWGVNFSHDLLSDGSNEIEIDVPDALLEAYEYHVRLSANSKHDLPERFSWFPKWVSEEFTDYVIDEARLVEQSLGYYWNDDQYTLHPGTMGVRITDRSANLFSLKNAPKSIPEGYRLLLAFPGVRKELNELGGNFNAYLDTSAASYDLEEPIENARFPDLREPVWKQDAKSLAANLSNAVLFVDLTDAIKDDADFKRATGVLFKWEAPSKNLLVLPSPTTSDYTPQPVWLIMKPIVNQSPPNANPPKAVQD